MSAVVVVSGDRVNPSTVLPYDGMSCCRFVDTEIRVFHEIGVCGWIARLFNQMCLSGLEIQFLCNLDVSLCQTTVCQSNTVDRYVGD